MNLSDIHVILHFEMLFTLVALSSLECQDSMDLLGTRPDVGAPDIRTSFWAISSLDQNLVDNANRK